jgi:hypothetical protein
MMANEVPLLFFGALSGIRLDRLPHGLAPHATPRARIAAPKLASADVKERGTRFCRIVESAIRRRGQFFRCAGGVVASSLGATDAQQHARMPSLRSLTIPKRTFACVVKSESQNGGARDRTGELKRVT